MHVRVDHCRHADEERGRAAFEGSDRVEGRTAKRKRDVERDASPPPAKLQTTRPPEPEVGANPDTPLSTSLARAFSLRMMRGHRSGARTGRAVSNGLGRRLGRRETATAFVRTR